MQKKRQQWLFMMISLVAVIAAYVSWVTSGGTAPGDRVIVSLVYDGDTIVVGRGWRRTTVRLIGVDTPETVHPDKPVQFFGPEASAFTRRSLLGTRVRLEFDDPDRPGGSIDIYGRTLAYVYTEDEKNFNLEIIRRGLGRAYTRFPFKYRKEFTAAERAARSRGIGMWSNDHEIAASQENVAGMIIGNSRSGIYHMPGQHHYDRVAVRNRVYFKTEEEARGAGYRKAKR